MARSQGTFLVLMALLEGPKHGYEVSKFIEAQSSGFFRMPFGTLYPILHRLEKNGFVTCTVEASGAEREKKVYRLTASGKKQAEGEVSEYQLFTRAVNKLMPG